MPDLPDLPDASDASDESPAGIDPDGPAVADPDGSPAGQPPTAPAPAAAGPGRGKLAAIAVAVVVVLVVVGLGFVATRKSDTAASPTSVSVAPPTTAARVAGTATLPATDTEQPTSVPAETFPEPVSAPPNTYPLPPAPYIVVTPKNQGQLAVYASPTAPTADRSLPNPRLINNDPNAAVPLTLLLRQAAANGFLEVFLPVRPNGSTGFVKAADVTQTPHDFHIEVRLSQFNLKAYQGSNVILDVPIAVASNNTPTPGGLYYTTELLKPPEANSPYGTYAYGLSGFSDVYKSFNGGPGQIGIHGTNTPSSIGKAVSNGCIRMRNEDIDKLAAVLPLGVPVQIIP